MRTATTLCLGFVVMEHQLSDALEIVPISLELRLFEGYAPSLRWGWRPQKMSSLRAAWGDVLGGSCVCEVSLVRRSCCDG